MLDVPTFPLYIVVRAVCMQNTPKNIPLPSGRRGEACGFLFYLDKLACKDKFIHINGKDLNSLTAEEIVDAVKKAYPDLAFDKEQAGYIITALKQGNNKVDAVEKLNNDTNIIPEYEINNLLEIKNLL